jgi:polyhydroxyalkanoate synthase
MDTSPAPDDTAIAQAHVAPQHGPRPLPLFLNILWRETEGDPDFRKRAFRGLRKYQAASRPAPPPPAPMVATVGNARLLHYGAENGRSPIIFIPSLINPPRVLDLSERRSLLRHIAAAKHDAYLVDWGTPAPEDRDLDLAGHIIDRLLPLIADLPRPPILIGYCLGGSIAMGAAAKLPVRALATLAAPWHFDRFPQSDRDQIAALWRSAKPVCERLGYIPMEVLQSGFWSLAPGSTIRKYAAFLDMAPGSETERAFLALEDWANAGPPLTFAAARDLFENFYADNLTGEGRWRIGDSLVPSVPDCPMLTIRSSTDRIVPADAAPRSGDVRTLALGHVGMVVGSRARETLWEPLSQWISEQGG